MPHLNTVSPDGQRMRGETVTPTWMIAGAAVGLLAGPRLRASAFAGSTAAGQPPRRECPSCSSQILPSQARWLSMLPVTGRCPACKERIGLPPLIAELIAAVALAAVAARASSGWEFAALAWLVLLAVPLSLIDIAVHRLPDRLTVAAFVGLLGLLTVAALAGHEPGRLGRAGVSAAALACFYLALCLIRPGEMGIGDAKLAASIGLLLGWTSWQALFTGTFAGFALAAVYGGARLAVHQESRAAQIPLGPFILIGAIVAILLLACRCPRCRRPCFISDVPLSGLSRAQKRDELNSLDWERGVAALWRQLRGEHVDGKYRDHVERSPGEPGRE